MLIISSVFGAKSLLCSISSLTVSVKPSLPAPEPYETTNILSPGSATSKMLDNANGTAPEYVFPILGVSNPCWICSVVNPHCLPALK